MNPADRTDWQQELAELRREQVRLFEQLQHNERHFRGLARSVLRVQEDERRRFARDLHDGIGQTLTALKLRLQAIQAHSAESELSTALALCEQALADTRALSRLMRPQILDDLGLAAALQWLARSSAESGGFAVEVDVDTLPQKLDPDLATLVFRIAQEGMANILKHAEASHVLLRVRQRAGWLQLLLVDDGKGFDPDQAAGKSSRAEGGGVAGMRERAAMFGADLQIRSEPGAGAQLRLQVALPEAAP